MPSMTLFQSKRKLAKATSIKNTQQVASIDDERNGAHIDVQSTGRRGTGRRKARHERNASNISGIKDLAEHHASNQALNSNRNADGTTGWGLSRKPNKFFRRSMDKIRRSLRQSLGRGGRGRDGDSVLGRRESKETTSTPAALQQDEQSVRNNTCAFNVKYFGCVEVYESRGMVVCEEALKALRNQRRKPVKAILYVSGDGLRVVDAENNRGLLVDQTIEKVSFCAPDRTNSKGFAYICRDGTTRRWLCHGFAAIKETGERLSHAVGCAFSVCLENKQKLDRETQNATATSVSSSTMKSPASVTSAVASSTNGQFSRTSVGSFRQPTLMERKIDPQSAIVVEKDDHDTRIKSPQLDLSSARARPSSNSELFNRQMTGSLRYPTPSPTAGQNFKRNYSMRAEIPSTQTQLPVNQSGAYQMPSQSSSVNTTPRITTKSASTIDEILDIFNTTDTPPESARSYQPLQHMQPSPSTSTWATSTPKKGHLTGVTPLWDQTFAEEDEDNQKIEYISPSNLPQSNTTDSFFGELDRQQQIEASPLRRAAPASKMSPSHESDDGQHSEASSSQRSKAEEWLQSTLRASLRRTPPTIAQSPPHTPFTPPPVPPRRQPNIFEPHTTQSSSQQPHQWQQFSPEKKTNTNVFQPQVDPFEEKWRAFSLQQANPFQHESTQVNI